MQNMKKALTLTVTLFIVQFVAFSQQRQDVLDYIAKYKDIAIEEMVRCKIPASITLAQGLHESGWGKSDLSKQANNHFGIKCKSDWDGKKFFKNDDAPNECFRVYEHAGDSYVDHSDFLVTRSRYTPLFQLTITDYRGWANGLKAYGYATNPKYPEILISTIEAYNLSQYDKQGLAEIAENESLLNHIGAPDAPEPLMASNTAPVKVQTARVAEQHAPVVTTTPVHQSVTAAPVAMSSPEITHKVEKTEPKVEKHEPIFASTPVNSNARKEYVVNGLRALRAQGNENPLTIAIDYDLDFARVLAMNDLAENELFKNGESIFLQPKKMHGEQITYVVQAGESMRDVSQKTGVRLKDLYQKNDMKFTENEQALAGEVIYLQEKRNGSPRTMPYSAYLKTQNKNSSADLNNSSSRTTSITGTTIPQPNHQYQVQQSDTLYSIAQKFNLSIEQLKAINNLENNPIRPGQTLLVSN